jgi:DNA (cytosine-5)-methyltransferase 1
MGEWHATHRGDDLDRLGQPAIVIVRRARCCCQSGLIRCHNRRSAEEPIVTEETVSVTTEEDVYRLRLGGGLSSLSIHPKLIDLFAGAGGMTAGFSRFMGQVFEPVWANDWNEYAVKTYNANFGGADGATHAVTGDIVDLLEADGAHIPEADVVVGGPPCQGYSLLNKNRDGDPRRHLWRPFLEVVRRSGAHVFVMENVPQLLGSPEHAAILAEAEGMGFATVSKHLCAADYGAPQTRWRTIVVGSDFCDPAEFFPPLRTNRMPAGNRRMFNGDHTDHIADAPAWLTVRDAIADLPQPVTTELMSIAAPLDLHFSRNPTEKSRLRYAAVPPGGNRFDLLANAPEITPDCWVRKTSGGTDLFGRLWWDRPSVTIRTEFYKPEKGRYLHPDQDRPITHREAARLMSFPDEFVFKGSKVEIAKQIGNAVPPALAARIADSVLAMLLHRP